MKDNPQTKITYEPEADVLMYEITDKPIDYAKEVGNFIIHFSHDNTPVLFEILEASNFLNKTQNIIKTQTQPTSKIPA